MATSIKEYVPAQVPQEHVPVMGWTLQSGEAVLSS